MAYKLYLDGVLFPVTPQKITMKINGKNEKVTLINEGEANILKAPGLTEIEFELLLPQQKYIFAVYENGYKPATYYLDKLKSLKIEKKAFQYKVTRAVMDGKKLFHTKMKVSLEDYTIVEDAGEGLDITVKIKLKQYREFVTKSYMMDISLPKPQAVMQTARSVSDNAPAAGNYTVVSGDSLWKISKKYYGTGSKWQTIYQTNQSVIGGNPNLIYPGQVLTIP